MAPRIGFMPGDTKAADMARNSFNQYRQWYRTTRWTKLRKVILLRDLYTCAMCGRISATGMDVDHKTPHRGDERLFWDESNLEVLCHSPCHAKHKQAQERAEERRP